MIVNRQISITKKRNGTNIKIRRWRTYRGTEKRSVMIRTDGKEVKLDGVRFKKWGIIGDLWEPGKIMVDIDEKTISHDRIRGTRGQKSKRQKDKSVGVRNVSKSREMVTPPDVPIQSLSHTCGLTVQWVRWDKTAHGWHVVIKVKQKLTLAETIAAQAILGSDLARERLNLARCISLRLHPSKYWEQRANILYEKKVKYDERSRNNRQALR